MKLKKVKNTTEHDVAICELQGKRLVLPPGATANNVNVTNPSCLDGCQFVVDLTEVAQETGKKVLHD